MSETRKIVVLAGDGIGPEIVGATRRGLDAVVRHHPEEGPYPRDVPVPQPPPQSLDCCIQ